jgi:hypothetical protein
MALDLLEIWRPERTIHVGSDLADVRTRGRALAVADGRHAQARNQVVRMHE